MNCFSYPISLASLLLTNLLCGPNVAAQEAAPTSTTAAVPATPAGQTNSAPRKASRAALKLALEALFVKGDKEKAQLDFAESARLDPTYAPPRYNLGLLAAADEHWDEALKWFAEVKTADPQSPYALKADAMLASVRKSQEADRTPEGKRSRQYQSLLDGAGLFLAEGQYVAAQTKLDAALTLDSARWQAYDMEARLAYVQGQTAKGDGLMDSAIQHAPPTIRPKLAAKQATMVQESQFRAINLSAETDFKNKQYLLASEKMRQICAMAPKDDSAVLRLAITLQMAGQQSQTVELYNKLAGSLDAPVAQQAKLQLAHIASAKQRAEQQDKEQTYAKLTHDSAADLRSSDYEAARLKLEQAYALFPDRDTTGLCLATTYALSGDTAQAEALLTRLEQSKHGEIAKEASARLAKIKGITAAGSAREALEAAVANLPAESSEVRRLKERIASTEQQIEQQRRSVQRAEQDAEEARQKQNAQTTDQARAIMSIVTVAANIALGQEQRGLTNLQNQREKFQSQLRQEQAASPELVLARNYIKAQRWQQAETAYTVMLEQEPGNAEYYSMLAYTEREQGKWHEAEEASRQACKMEPTNPDYVFGLVEALRGGNKPEEAETELLSIYKKSQNSPFVVHEYGLILFDEKNYLKAEPLLRRAVGMLPKANPVAGLFRGDLAGCLFRAGKMKEARHETEEAQKMGLQKHWVYKELGL